MSLALSELGYFVTSAVNAREALRILEINIKNGFHTIITDHEMPGMNGLELIETILIKKYPHERLIHLSGSIDYHSFVSSLTAVNPKIIFMNKSMPISEIKSILA